MQKNRVSSLLFFILPGCILFGIFTIYPLIKTFILSFYEWGVRNENNIFVGLGNYIRVFSDSTFRISIVNVFFYALVSVPGQMIIGLLLAYILNQKIKGGKLFRVFYFLPVITSWVVASLIFKYIFGNYGLVNYILNDLLRLIRININWLNERWSALAVLQLLGIWKGIGWAMVIFLAALQKVPLQLYEAAKIDGCNHFKSFFLITIPLIKENILFVLVMLSIGAFNVFTSVYLITGGGPFNQTEMPLTLMYKNAFRYLDFGFASALSYILAIIISIITIFQFKFFERSDGVE
ncbi:MAG TPA: sugar ABC transporter permease [Halanaerobiales bacterium]|nr:sugar ABC transporter permease [Halanaerobiales bacterium]